MALTLTLGTIAMNGVADGNGAKWYVTDFGGWDSAPVRSSTIELPARHGGVTVEGLYGPRLMTITGICKAPSEAAFYASMELLYSETNVLNRWASNPLVLRVQEGASYDRRVSCFRNGSVRTKYTGVGAFTFEVPLRADDPFRYSETLHSTVFVANTPQALSNAGSARTYLTVTLGATGTPIITCGSLEWRGSASIPSGTVIDMQAQTALNGSTDHFDKVDLTSEWLFLDSDSNALVESNLAMTVTWRDAWV